MNTPVVIPRLASKPVPSLNLIVPVPPVESPSALPLWKISRLPVTLFTLAVTLVTFVPIAVATFDNAVPPVVIVITSEPENASEVSGAPVETPPTRSATSVIKIGVIAVNV